MNTFAAKGSEVADLVATGVVQVQSLGEAQELNSFNMRRPMHCVVLEPNFGRRNNRQLVSGGMAGVLTIHEKGWLGNKETKIHEGEGPIWAVAWRGNLIAWANDMVRSSGPLLGIAC